MFKPRDIARIAAVLAIFFAVFSAPANSQPAATTWVLQKGHNISARPPRTPHLRMEGEKLSGSTGCNAFTAKVSERADKRIAIEQVALTRMMCAPKQNKIEAALVRALEQTEFIVVKGTRLSFLSARRQPLLVWTRNDKSAAKRPMRRKHYARVRTRHAFANRRCLFWEARTTGRLF